MPSPQGDGSPRRRVGLLAGALLAVVGLVLLGVAVIGGRDDGGSAAPGSTTAVTGRLDTGTTTTVARSTGAYDDVVGGTTTPTTPTDGLGEGYGPERNGRRALRGFGEATITITGTDGSTCTACVLAATTEAQRERGLMEVADDELGGYEGMIFVYPEEIEGSFWMRNTPQEIGIAFWDGDGKLVSYRDMVACEDSPTCPSYPAGGAFRYAVEVVDGRLSQVGTFLPGATLRIDSYDCPLAAGS